LPLIQFLRVLHLLITLFVVFGWALPFRTAWLIELFFIPAMVIHWKTNNGDCILTNIEQRWLAKQQTQPVQSNKDDGEFTRRILKPFLGDRELTRKELEILIYVTITISWVICLMRFRSSTS
jgi:hypothetical protein